MRTIRECFFLRQDLAVSAKQKKGLANVAIASPHMLPPMRVIVCATRYGVTVRVPFEIDTT
jgi:hypothetical protein